MPPAALPSTTKLALGALCGGPAPGFAQRPFGSWDTYLLVLPCPGSPPPLTSQMRPKKDELGARRGFLKMNNLGEAGPVPFIS